MQILKIENITDLFVVLDDILKSDDGKKVGRPSVLSKSETITILIWCTYMLKSKNIRDIYNFIHVYHRSEFPKLPDYSNFVRHCQRCLPLMVQMIEESLDADAEVRFVDSTMLPVCKNVRADQHKVAKKVARWGKNHQGWHYGFKLHASVNKDGYFCGFHFTPANEHDAQQLVHLVRGNAKIVVGDGGYCARVMREIIWREFGTYVLAPPHPKQKKFICTKWQITLLQMRPKVESMFDYLKEHMHLVSSFPRSIAGYAFHYIRVILAYQFQLAFC